MLFPLKKVFFAITFNTSLFMVLIIGIQNSSKKERVNFLIDKTIELPISFIIGSSFISGSIFGSLFCMNSYNEK